MYRPNDIYLTDKIYLIHIKILQFVIIHNCKTETFLRKKKFKMSSDT